MEQAKGLKEYFDSIPIDLVFASPLNRCLQTAKILCEDKQQDITVVKEFAEIHLGLWENQPIDSIRRNFPDAYEERGKNLLTFRPPEGESFGQLAERVLPAFYRIRKLYSGNMIIVGHAGVNRTILCHLQGTPVQDIFQIQQPYGCVYELTGNDTLNWQVKRVL